MGVIRKGFDPDLGRRFAEENQGLIFAMGAKRPIAPKTCVGLDGSPQYDDEMPLGLDAQQHHDWLMLNPGSRDPSVDDDEE
ncbi:hypothetical protein [Rhizobacter sp. Root404]|uniref:hypothetical protein n=1 Tax=Rhizobacter sp. Root404 TaxID=1736528 RepID=UPI0006FADF4B|nr:hypothetical protein [Rhizobacter sp. Root404]KQW38548.1 hypothetical protein ASC76_11110 [Rhizobacter sp. Root404]